LQCCRFLFEAFFDDLVKLGFDLGFELLDHTVLLQRHLGVFCEECLAETTASQGFYNFIAMV
jgi:hypothetical protein